MMTPSWRRILRDSPTRGGGCAAVKTLVFPRRTAVTVAVRQRIVRRPPRPRKVESQSDDEVAEAKEIHSSALPVRVMLSVRPWPCQVPANVASVALSPPQPSSTKIVIAAAGSAAIRDDEVMSHFHPPRHTRSGEFP